MYFDSESCQRYSSVVSIYLCLYGTELSDGWFGHSFAETILYHSYLFLNCFNF